VKDMQIIKNYLNKINQYSEKNLSEFENLMDRGYCSEILNNNFPFYMTLDDIEKSFCRGQFFSKVYTIHNKTVKINHRWGKHNFDNLYKYIISKNIETEKEIIRLKKDDNENR
jgi:hypothetical protein